MECFCAEGSELSHTFDSSGESIVSTSLITPIVSRANPKKSSELAELVGIIRENNKKRNIVNAEFEVNAKYQNKSEAFKLITQMSSELRAIESSGDITSDYYKEIQGMRDDAMAEYKRL